MTPSPSGPALFENDKERVLEAFRGGKFDAVEVVSEVVERELFSFLRNQRLLTELAESYPTPRVKEEVPVWFYLAADVALRLHGRHSFNSFPLVVRSGGLLSLLGPEKAQRRIDPTTGDLHLKTEGFNDKNAYPRQTPCDADFLRKMAHDTDPGKLLSWFGAALPQALKKRHAFDREGIFIGDGSYLFVPDNPNYEGSTKMWFDEHNHPVTLAKVAPEDRHKMVLRRCYKMVTLLHINRAQDYYFYVGARVVPGKTSEVALLYDLVDDFVRAVGRGVMKLLILDRGFIDGEAIGKCKEKHRTDVLIPLRKDMDLFVDVMGFAARQEGPTAARDGRREAVPDRADPGLDRGLCRAAALPESAAHLPARRAPDERAAAKHGRGLAPRQTYRGDGPDRDRHADRALPLFARSPRRADR